MAPDRLKAALSMALAVVLATLVGCALVAPFMDGPGPLRYAPALFGLAVGLPLGWRFRPIPADAITWLAARRLAARLVVALTVLAAIHTARHSTYMMDPGFRWGRALPTDGTQHSCLAAYLRAGELVHLAPDSVYDADAYVASAANGSQVVGLRSWLGDPFAYPPQALLPVVAALSVSDRLLTLRSAWFAISALFFGAIAYLAAVSLRGEARWMAWSLVPALWMTLPVVYGFEYGQAHLVTLAAALAGMIAFERGRPGVGGLALAAAIALKLFPGLLLVYLAVRRQWSAILWTTLWSALLLGAALLFVGTEVVGSFVTEQLPSLLGGQAFDRFFPADELPVPQLSLAGLGRALGLDAGAPLSRVLGLSYGVFALTLTVFAARLSAGPVVWLAILNLGAMQSPFVPASYAAAGILWLASLWIAQRWRQPRVLWASLAACAYLQTVPFLGDVPGLRGHTAVPLLASIPMVMMALALCASATLSRREVAT